MINFYDMLGFYEKVPKFAKKYTNIREIIIDAVHHFINDINTGEYPTEEYSYK